MVDDRSVETSSHPGLVERAKGILMRPKEEWPRIASERTEPMRVLTSYVIPLALIGPIATLIGMQVFGINVLFATVRPSFGFTLTTAITSFVMTLIGVFVLAFIANFLSPKFGGKDDFPAAFRLVAYAMTASWVGGIFGLIPMLAILGLIFGLYSLYLLYLGAEPVMGVPKDKSGGYTAVTIVAAIVVYLIIGAVTASITGAMSMGAAGIAAADDTATIDLGELGTVNVDGENSTVDLGEMGKVEVNGDTATLTVDGESVKIDAAALEAQAQAAQAQVEAAQAQAEAAEAQAEAARAAAE